MNRLRKWLWASQRTEAPLARGQATLGPGPGRASCPLSGSALGCGPIRPGGGRQRPGGPGSRDVGRDRTAVFPRIVLSGAFFWRLALALCVFGVEARILAEDNTSLVVEGVVTNTGLRYVGRTGTNNSLLIINGGRLFSPAAFQIGAESTANRNYAVVAGSRSVWNVGSLSVGEWGSHNLLVISNGAWVFSVGNVMLKGGSSNAVDVVGPDAGWSIDGSLEFSYWARGGNRLRVTGGGRVTCRSTYVDTPNSSIKVNGPGSECDFGERLLLRTVGVRFEGRCRPARCSTRAASWSPVWARRWWFALT